MTHPVAVKRVVVARKAIRLERGTIGADGADGADGLNITADPTTKLYPIVDGFAFNDTPTGTPADVEGEVYWNPDDKTLNIVTGLGQTVQVGQEVFGIGTNKTGAQVDNGKCVYMSGVIGNRPTVGYADARDINKCGLVGIVTANIANNADGPVVTFGIARGYDTSAWAPGTKLYVAGDATGTLTNTAPTTNGTHQIWVATTLNQTANGDIFVNTVHEFHAFLERHGAVRYGTTAITGTSTCTIDWSTGAVIYTFAKTVPVTLELELSSLPEGAWGIILEITDDGGGDTVSYPANWKEIGGTAMSVTTSGIDRWYITGYGSTDTNVRVSQTLDWKAS